MKWITRAHINIDRVACPWLIKRFIDTDAEFYFVAKEHVLETAKMEKGIPFDVPCTPLSAKEDGCAFISFLQKYKLTEPALWKIGELILATQKSHNKTHPFASCLEAVSQGFSLLFPDDLENIEQQYSLYDALYNYYRLQTKDEQGKVVSKKKTNPELLFNFPHENKK